MCLSPPCATYSWLRDDAGNVKFSFLIFADIYAVFILYPGAVRAYLVFSGSGKGISLCS
jgi:hypothetical protein